jgi:glycine/D-amino acid oxidase-like deaminating enzyme/nitrite reductase/ring-hydroxylating ferredoxin subunit
MPDAVQRSTESAWLRTPPSFPPTQPLREDLTADVCVGGGGIAGLTTAYLLGRSGKKVVVLEKGELGSGETLRTTAHLASALDDRFTELERLHGPQGARMAAESHAAAINRIEEIARLEGVDCDFRWLDGYLFVRDGDSRDVLEKELEAARRAGLHVEGVLRAPLPTYDTGPCLKFAEQAQFNPAKYLVGLAEAVRRQGGRLFTHSPVKDFEGGSQARAVTHDGRTVRAGALVVATNTPVNDRVTLHTKQAAYRTYAIACRVPAGRVTPALYWDTADPYHYVRLADQPGPEDLLIVGGEDHKTGQGRDEPACYRRLEEWARQHFSCAGAVEARWAGQVMEPVDGLAFIGRNPGDEENVYIATGDSGHGMTHGTIAGMLLTDLILGRPDPWATLYDPSRKTLRAAKEFLRENLNVAAQYADFVTPGDVKSASDLAPGEGAVIREGLHKLAVYKDEQGRVQRHSAVCPHLGCVVHWNKADRSFDCPCHGSRFRPNGEVINGPSLAGLSEIKD